MRRTTSSCESSTPPTPFVATTRTTYRPPAASLPLPCRPFQVTACGPGWRVRRATVRTSTPSSVSTVTRTRATRVCVQRTVANAPVGGSTSLAGSTRRKPSVELTANRRIADDGRPWSSTAFTVSVHLPSAGGSGAGGGGCCCPSEGEGSSGGGSGASGGNGTSYVPGSRGPPSWKAITPPGAVKVTETVEGRTILNASSCSSATSSPFGESTASAGGSA